MDESFTVVILFNEEELSFEARLAATGYTHKFYVIINGMEVIYEPDEERNYRAILNGTDQGPLKDTDIALIKAVGHKIESLHH